MLGQQDLSAIKSNLQIKKILVPAATEENYAKITFNNKLFIHIKKFLYEPKKLINTKRHCN